MKKGHLILLISLLLPILPSCGKTTSVSISYDGLSKQCQFSIDKIKESLSTRNYKVVDLKADYQIVFHDIDINLGEQSYSVSIDDNTIHIKAGDETGLMYGGLDVAEQIDLYDINHIVEKNETPDLMYRGLKFNCPLDMRTPSYTDGGDSGQDNIEVMWDIEFWKEQFNYMAEYRYNALSLWNLNPFPSMVKVPDYPDVALADVWKTTIPFDGTYKGNATDLVRDQHWTNYEVVKTMTIDEKISHWKQVMSLAHDRGIKVYVYTWNIYTFGEHGKYGITADQDNPITKDYYRKAVEAFVDTYPDLDGLGIGAGENMKVPSGDSNSGSMGSGYGDQENEIWLWDTYGEGITASLNKTPERKFEVIHRMHYADGETLRTIWGGLPCEFNVSDKYSTAHMYSAEKPHLVDKTIEGMTEDQQLWLEVRNDDNYFHRYGGTSFARSYVSQMPEETKGFLMGADGYIQGKEFTSTDDDIKGQLYIRKHWYNYMLFGRLGYNPSLRDDFFKAKLASYFKNIGKSVTDVLFDAMDKAGTAFTYSNAIFYSAGDSWYPEGNWTNPNTFGYVGIKRLINSRASNDNMNILSIPDYCICVENGKTISGKVLPTEVVEIQNTLADGIFAAQETLKSVFGKDTEFDQFVLDTISFANLAKYYAYKTEATIALRLFNDTDDVSKKTTAVEKSTKANEYFTAYADDMIQRYADNIIFSRAGVYSFSNVKSEVFKDISACEKWTKKSY